MKANCWETMKCGRESGGAKVSQLGVCPAALETRLQGVNAGLNGGRSCWALAGTLCGGKAQGTFASKLTNCMACEFYKSVRHEEGPHLATTKEIVAKLAP